MNDKEIKIYDGEYEIIFSNSFNLYQNELKIAEIAGFTFVFTFDKGQFSLSGLIEIKSDTTKKIINVSVKNFRNSLGAVNTEKLPVINLADGRKIFLSIYGKTLNPEFDFMQIVVNFYLK